MIAVLTDPRRQGHLQRTLAEVDSSAQDQNRIVVVDGDVAPPLPPGWRAALAPKPRSAPETENRWATWRAFELAAEADEDLLFLEDDLIGCEGAALYCEKFAVPRDCAMVMFYAPWGDASLPWRLWRIHASQFSFCQVLKIPLATVRELRVARLEMERCKSAGSDECIRAIGGARDWLVGVHYPGLWQHVGMQSVVNGERSLNGHRISRAFLTDHPASLLAKLPWRNDYR